MTTARKGDDMSKLLTTLAAGVVALGLNCAVLAADQEQGQPQDQKQEYIAALKKCDSLQGAAKQQCVEDVNRKFGRM
jgi:hypothetical protein